MLGHLEGTEEVAELFDGEFAEFCDALACYLDVFCLFLEAAAMADGTGGLSAIAGEHDAILNLVLVLLEHAEELVDADAHVAPFVDLRHSMPEDVFLLLCELVVWGEDREVVALCCAHKLLLPFRHLIALPALHASVIDGEFLARYDTVFVNANDLAVAFAFRACAYGGIEGEHLVCRFFKLNAVCLEFQRKLMDLGRGVLGRDGGEDAFAIALVECCLGRADEPGYGLFVIARFESVDD